MTDPERFPALALRIPEASKVAELDLRRDFGARGDGTSDDATAFLRLATAVNDGRVPNGAVVRVPVGTYRVCGDKTVMFRRPLILRGDGAAETKLVLEYAVQGAVFLKAEGEGTYVRHTRGTFAFPFDETANAYPSASFARVRGTPRRGDRRARVHEPGLFAPGDHAYLLCDDYGTEVAYDRGRRAAHFLLKQHLQVAGVRGDEVAFAAPLRHDFAGAAPRLYRWRPLVGFGIEHLSIEDRSSVPESEVRTTFRAVQFDGVVDGWVWDVQFLDSTSIPLSVERSRRVVVSHCLFDDARHVGAGGNGYLPRLMLTDDSLIEHCTSIGGRHALICDWSCWGNVFRYNRVVGTPNIETHGEYSVENLYLRNDAADSRMEIGGGWLFHGHDGPYAELRENYARALRVLKEHDREDRLIGNWYIEEIADRGIGTVKEGNRQVPSGWNEYAFAAFCGHDHAHATETAVPARMRWR